jgi:hypothetical protein
MEYVKKKKIWPNKEIRITTETMQSYGNIYAVL